jgi:kynurenine formamidase
MAAAAPGLIGRGVLLDIPSLRGLDYIEPEDPVDVAELEQAEATANLQVAEGDILLIRVGRHVRERMKPGSGQLDGRSYMPGLHPNCLPWLHRRGVAVLGSDSASDAMPSQLSVAVPIHVGALVFMGCPLLDNALLDDLFTACAERGRWSFLFSLGPLHLHGATGTPVNPTALF